MRLLTDNLSPAQRDQLEVFNYFDVIGGDTGTRYRIRFGTLMNVEELDSSGKRTRRCVSRQRVAFPSQIRCWLRKSR